MTNDSNQVGVIYLTMEPAAGWTAAMAVRVLLVAVPAAAWVVLHLASWWHMRLLLAAFRSSEVREMLALSSRRVSSSDGSHVPDQLQPLLQGAWLVSDLR